MLIRYLIFPFPIIKQSFFDLVQCTSQPNGDIEFCTVVSLLNLVFIISIFYLKACF